MAKIDPTIRLSIIIPTINEAKFLPLLLADINLCSYEFELIIVDAGSVDSTKLIARLGGAKLICLKEKNRGMQLHKGALIAKGEWLLFLHADSRLNKYWVEKVSRVIEEPLQKKYAWFFDFKVKSKGFVWSILELAVLIRSNLLKRPYGDQGLLLSKELYLQVGGYKEIPLMEDIDLIIRLGQINLIKALGVGIQTSTRKYENNNIFNIALKNAILRFQWHKGKDLRKLTKQYYSKG